MYGSVAQLVCICTSPQFGFDPLLPNFSDYELFAHQVPFAAFFLLDEFRLSLIAGSRVLRPAKKCKSKIPCRLTSLLGASPAASVAPCTAEELGGRGFSGVHE